MGDTVVISFLHPGVAQFGSALEWGSRGRRFDSSHSDQMNRKIPGIVRFRGFFYVSVLDVISHCCRKKNEKANRKSWDVPDLFRFAFCFMPWYNREIKGRHRKCFVQPKEEAQQ